MLPIVNSAYIQSWYQDRLSRISFDIAPKYGWDPWTNEIHRQKKRHADVYVFCLLAHKDQATINPLDLDQWRFLVLATKTLNQRCPKQKTIGLASLRRLQPVEASFVELKTSMEQVVGEQI